MQAQTIQITKYGSAQELVTKPVEIDENLKEDEVIIEVKYSGINFADIVMRLGMYKDAPPRPFTPGYEISGIIKAKGSKVTRFEIGEEVMAGTRFGGYASHIKIPAWQTLKINKEINLQQASAIPVNYITSYIALHEFARIREEDKILIDCATGGVGVIAMQMAKEAGCIVIGLTSNPDKKAFIESYGAKAYTHEEFINSNEAEFDFILNSRGGKTIKDQYNRLSRSGQLSCIGLQDAINNGKSNIFQKLKAALQTPWYPLLKLVMNSKSVSGFNALAYFDDDKWMKKHLPKLEQSTFKPHIGGVFPSGEISKAHEFLENRKARGKVLIQWNS